MSMADRDGVIWYDGAMCPWRDATTHVLTHTLHYGMGVFEGVRAYHAEQGTAIFRLREHTDRLFRSAHILQMPMPFDRDTLNQAQLDVVRENGLDSAYLRPMCFYGSEGMGLRADNLKVHVIVAAWEWGAYLGAEGLEQGVDVCISSWQRVAPNTIPAMAKAGGNYLSGQLISTEARRLGFAEGIALSTDGTVSEGAGENVFVVKDGRIITPPSASSILSGLTRDSVIKLADRMGLDVVEQSIPREALYLADEIFLTGTAAEITPIRSVDRIEIGPGRRGPLTEHLQQAFFGLFNGETEDTEGWLEAVTQATVAAAGSA